MAEPNRLQKMLEGANIKLSDTVADINGKSARSTKDGEKRAAIQDITGVAETSSRIIISVIGTDILISRKFYTQVVIDNCLSH